MGLLDISGQGIKDVKRETRQDWGEVVPGFTFYSRGFKFKHLSDATYVCLRGGGGISIVFKALKGKGGKVFVRRKKREKKQIVSATLL